MNKLTIIGNLVKNPEMRSTTAGVPVCGFTVAVNRPKTDKNPNPGADYFNVSAWRNKGEVCAKYLEKGSKVCVVGEVTLRTWDTNGKHGASLEVKAEDVEFLSKAPVPVDAPQEEQQTFQPVETDELPF